MSSEAVRAIVGRKRTLEILEQLSDGDSQNYSEIETALETSSDTLSNSLTLLQNHGLITRNERSKKNVQYEITQRGDRFLVAVKELDALLADDR